MELSNTSFEVLFYEKFIHKFELQITIPAPARSAKHGAIGERRVPDTTPLRAPAMDLWLEVFYRFCCGMDMGQKWCKTIILYSHIIWIWIWITSSPHSKNA
jgi:hypothetical protein